MGTDSGSESRTGHLPNKGPHIKADICELIVGRGLFSILSSYEDPRPDKKENAIEASRREDQRSCLNKHDCL